MDLTGLRRCAHFPAQIGHEPVHVIGQIDAAGTAGRDAAVDEKSAASESLGGGEGMDRNPISTPGVGETVRELAIQPVVIQFVRPNPVNALWDRAFPGNSLPRRAVIEAAVDRPAGHRQVAVGLAAAAHAQLRTFEEQPQLAAVRERRVVSFAAVIAHVSSCPLHRQFGFVPRARFAAASVGGCRAFQPRRY